MENAKEISPLFTADQIAARVRELGAAIRAESGTSEVFYLGILKGAALFLGDLLRATPGEVTYGFIDVIRDVSDNTTADALEIDFLSYTDIRGRNVYVLKDVVTSGVIENYLLEQLRVHEPKSLRLVALLDKKQARTVDLQTHLHAFEIADGATYAGYGLEKNGRFGNLGHIGRLPG